MALGVGPAIVTGRAGRVLPAIVSAPVHAGGAAIAAMAGAGAGVAVAVTSPALARLLRPDGLQAEEAETSAELSLDFRRKPGSKKLPQ